MQFYEYFLQKCMEKGVTPTKACKDMGLSNATASGWNNRNSVPTELTMLKIAKYFGVSANEVVGYETYDPDAAPSPETETEQYLELLRTRPEMRMLFDSAKGASREQIEAVAKMIEGFRNAD